MVEDLALELAQALRRLETELAEQRAALAVGVEGVSLPICPVQREHQVLTKRFARRMLRRQAFQFADDVRVAAESELRRDSFLYRGQTGVLEARDLRLCPRLALELGEWPAAPEGQRVREQSRSEFGVTGGARLAPLRDQALEAVEVELVAIELQDVPRVAAAEPIRQHLPQPRDVDVHARDRTLGRVVRP